MIFYFLILFYWLLLFAFGKKEITNARLFLAILPLFLIMALKSVSVGSDTISYYMRYIGAIDMLSAENTITEPGYNLISYFFHDIVGVKFWVYNALMSAFVCFILALFLKHFSNDIYISLFVYMTIGLFSMSMSGLRQILAINICTIPIIWSKVCEERGNESMRHKFLRLIVGIVLVFLAYTIHNSAIIFLPILFILDVRLSKPQTIIVLIVAISVFLFRNLVLGLLSNFMLERYEKYDLEEGYMMNFLALLVPITIGLFCVIVSKPDNGDRLYSKSFSILFIFLSLQVMFNNLALSQIQISRLGFYFGNACIILIPYALKKMSVQIQSIITLVIIIFCLVYFYLGTRDGTLRIDDYMFFWEEPMYLLN